MIKSLLVYHLFLYIIVSNEYTKVNNKSDQTNNICTLVKFTTVYW